jgi:hypothetical protein
MVRVGEEEKTSAEMEEMLSRSTEKRSYWWTWPLVVVLLTVVLIGWHLSKNGVNISSTGNNKTVSPADVPATHQTLH